MKDLSMAMILLLLFLFLFTPWTPRVAIILFLLELLSVLLGVCQGRGVVLHSLLDD
jgi:hypothetical protein